MAISTAPRCEIRALVMHAYPVALALLRSNWHQGLWPRAPHHLRRPPRQARPQLRTMPMARTQELARKLQGRFGATVSVI